MATVEKNTQREAGRKVREEIRQAFGKVPSWIEEIPPAALEGFWGTMRDLQLGETAIPNKYKELIGLGISGATRCRYCALFHTEAARLFGATEEEISEAAMMAAHTMSASTFLNAMQVDYESFRRETLDAISWVRDHMPMQQQQQGKPSSRAHA